MILIMFAQATRPYRGYEVDLQIFSSVIGRKDIRLFIEERKLEKKWRETILKASKEKRIALYKQAYNEIYEFFQVHSAYKPLDRSNIEDVVRKLSRSSVSSFANKCDKALDIGCGDGSFSLSLASRCNEVYGIDISDQILKLARLHASMIKIKNVKFVNMSADKLMFKDGFFDCVISREVIEHLHPDDVRMHIAEVYRVLRPNGCYIITTPNRFSGYKIPLHLKEYSYYELYTLLSSFGFKDIKSNIGNLFLINIKTKIALERLYQFFKLSSALWILLGLDHINLIAYKRKL